MSLYIFIQKNLSFFKTKKYIFPLSDPIFREKVAIKNDKKR